jgi:hypothetical protein
VRNGAQSRSNDWRPDCHRLVEGIDAMNRTQQPFPVSVRTGWIDFSPALPSYARTRVVTTLGTFVGRIRFVTVRVVDNEPHDPATRRRRRSLRDCAAGLGSMVRSHYRGLRDTRHGVPSA